MISFDETGGRSGSVQVAPVSHIWLQALVTIDSSWNPTHWSERLFLQELSNPAARVRGVFVDQTLVGYLIAHIVFDEAHIVSLGVADNYRGQGFGRLLVEDLKRIAAVESVAVITLQVRASNEVAQKLYRKVGFRIAGVRKRYYSDNNEDAWTMRYEIAKVD